VPLKISTSEIAIVIMLPSYSRQRRTIGSFSATAGLLVLTLSLAYKQGWPNVSAPMKNWG